MRDGASGQKLLNADNGRRLTGKPPCNLVTLCAVRCLYGNSPAIFAVAQESNSF
ncbi:hypothetical protein D3C78_870390 [compost metagenome]